MGICLFKSSEVEIIRTSSLPVKLASSPSAKTDSSDPQESLYRYDLILETKLPQKINFCLRSENNEIYHLFLNDQAFDMEGLRRAYNISRLTEDEGGWLQQGWTFPLNLSAGKNDLSVIIKATENGESLPDLKYIRLMSIGEFLICFLCLGVPLIFGVCWLLLKLTNLFFRIEHHESIN
ncbi:MAG: hypothetical protein SFT81_01895 [Candidatus Caenarcaniphilales bacterium]|nr:hypothetical protein [Candidatus Caenarcaniphilales bacterium]